ncbi:outer membrane beta-barrel protein [Aureivirga sp. CE67]|uniref:outer membrane beta-barrel protein n=1 Tax=Aureivirga sp. CE67 TaxID=1788983 RepID=UPI0018C9BAF4|nr:outer membrane beta-barrel protein [Aureivirga sp. CE67]
MKKLIFAFLFLLSIATMNAQEKGTSQINVGYGILSSNWIIDSFSEIITYPASLGTITYDNENTSGTIFINYKYAVQDRWMIGAAFAYESIKKDVNFSGVRAGKQKNQSYTVVIETDYRYISSSLFQMYSGAGIGYTFTNQDFTANSTANTSTSDNGGNVNFQLTAVGLRLGSDFAFFAEAGFGYKGILNAGLSYQF